jgi:hypothetical protein
VECSCETENANIYVVYGQKKKMTTTILIIVIVVPAAACIIISAAVAAYCCIKKKALAKIKTGIVKALDTSHISMVPTVN